MKTEHTKHSWKRTLVNLLLLQGVAALLLLGGNELINGTFIQHLPLLGFATVVFGIGGVTLLSITPS